MTMYLDVSEISPRQLPQPRSALLPAAPAHRAPANLPPSVQSQLLRSTIGHAAALSDTPEKWAATIDLLRQHGIDPGGFEDFEQGRQAAIAASGISVPSSADEGEGYSNGA